MQQCEGLRQSSSQLSIWPNPNGSSPFRFCGPLEGSIEKTWVLNDFEEIE